MRQTPIVLVLAVTLLSTAALAQIATPPGTPVERILPSPQVPRVSPGVAAPAEQAPASAVPQGNVAVASVAITGATAFPEARLLPLVAGLTGPAVPIASIEAGREAILGLYRAQGFLFTSVRASVEPGGVATFQVIEGYIADVALDGDIGPAGTQVLRFLRHLTEVRPIDIATLERWLLLAQDIPGVSVRGVLRPTAGDPGALQLVAQVSRKLVDGFFTGDNRGPRFAGPEQAITVLGVNSLTSYGERTEALVYYAAGGTQRFAQAGFESFLGGSGLKFKIYAGYGQASPSLTLRALGYAGETRVFGTALSYPIVRRRSQSLTAIGGFDLYDNHVDAGPDNQGQKISDDQLRIFRFGGDYVVLDTLLGAEFSGTNTFTGRVHKGISGLGAKSSFSNPLPGRLGSVTDFLKFSAEIARTQTLYTFNETSSFALRVGVGGQYTDDILPPSEKFFLGGSRYGRGFYAGEVTGDKAIGGGVELQFSSLMDASLPDADRPIGYQLYLFRDLAQSFENQESDPNLRLSSWGGGARISLTDNVSGEAEGARRLTRNPGNSTAPGSEQKAWQFFYRLLVRF